mgnify:CR=1 FL=1
MCFYCQSFLSKIREILVLAFVNAIALGIAYYFYALPSTKSTRAAGFGIGERFKSVSGNNSPSPDRYDVPSLFNPDNSTSTFAVHCKTRTFAFGTGREAYKVVTN